MTPGMPTTNPVLHTQTIRVVKQIGGARLPSTFQRRMWAIVVTCHAFLVIRRAR